MNLGPIPHSASGRGVASDFERTYNLVDSHDCQARWRRVAVHRACGGGFLPPSMGIERSGNIASRLWLRFPMGKGSPRASREAFPGGNGTAKVGNDTFPRGNEPLCPGNEGFPSGNDILSGMRNNEEIRGGLVPRVAAGVPPGECGVPHGERLIPQSGSSSVSWERGAIEGEWSSPPRAWLFPRGE